MPKFRTIFKDYGHVNVSRFKDLGFLIQNIRAGKSTVPEKHKAELICMNLFFSTENMAMHVSKILGRSVTNINEEVRFTIIEAAYSHSKLLQLRNKFSTKEKLLENCLLHIPFGRKPLGDGMLRFERDLKAVC